IPVVFSSINDFDSKMLDGRNDITGTSENTDYLGTINIAVKLRPKTKKLVVVTDNTTTGQAHRSAIEKLRDTLPKYLAISFISLGEMTLDELGTALSNLKEDSVVLLVQHFVDKNGISHSLPESTPLITSRSPVPVFALTDSRMGFGTLGGHVVSGYHHGATAAGMVVDVLKGKSIGSIPVMLDSPNKFIFDFRVMERFSIPEKLLPPESIIINKPDTVLDLYKKYSALVTLATIVLACTIIWMWREIKSRKTAEDALKNREEIFSLFMRHSPVYVYIKEVTPTGSRVLQASDNFEEMVGIAGSNMKGKMMAELFPVEFTAKTDADDRAVVAMGKILKVDEDLNGRNYTTIKFPLVQGGQTLLAGYTIDITERKQAEMALQKSEQNFRAIIEVSPMPLAVNDDQGNITYLNKAFVNTIGYTTDDIPVLEKWWPLAYPDEQYRQSVADAWVKHLEDAKRTGLPFVPMEINVICKDGSERTFICSTAPLEESFAGSHLVIFYDITDRKRAEAGKLAFEQQFQQTQKLESLGILAGGIAHDFNNILMAIIGNADLALMRINKDSPATENLHRIEQAAA
ncbi:MAG: ABC transporter substrate binding protein, partial [Deltaproteobacteria bacterium]